MPPNVGGSGIGKLIAYLGLDDTLFVAGISRAFTTMRAAGQQMKALGRSLTTYVTAPFLALSGLSIKAATNFEEAFSKMEGLVGITRGALRGMKKEVLELAPATGRGPQELGDALYFITSAGLRGRSALDVLNKSARAAAAGLGETAVIADLVTSAVNAYGEANLNAAQATDTLVDTVREGKAEAKAIAPVLGYVLPVSSALGVSFQEVGAALASMTRTGTDADTAVTQLRQILVSFLDPAQQSEEALRMMGLSGQELRQQLKDKGLLSVLQTLKDKVGSNISVLGKILPNVRALAGALDIVGSNMDANIGIFQRMTNSTGSLDRAFEAASSTAQFRFNQALAELKVVAIDIGELLIPIFTDFLRVVRNVVNWFKSLSEEGKKMALTIAGIAAAAGPVLTILGGMTVAIAAIGTTVGAVLIGVAALGAGIIYLWDNWEAVKERISDWSWWRNALIEMAQFAIRYNPIALPFKLGFELALKIMEALGREVPEKMQKMAEIMANPFEAVASSLELLKVETKEYEHQFGTFTDSLINAAKAAGKAIADLFPKGGRAGAFAGSGVNVSSTISRGGISSKALPIELPNAAKSMNAALAEMNNRVANLNAQWAAMGRKVVDVSEAIKTVLINAIVDFATMLGNALTGDAGVKGFFNNILLVVLDFANQFGKVLVATSVAALAFQNLMINPVAGIIAGVALIALSTAAKNLLMKGPAGQGDVQGLASGGFVTQGGVFQLHKDELVTLPSGSAVTPADMAMGVGNGRMRVVVEGRISGANLDLIQKKEAYRKSRLGG